MQQVFQLKTAELVCKSSNLICLSKFIISAPIVFTVVCCKNYTTNLFKEFGFASFYYLMKLMKSDEKNLNILVRKTIAEECSVGPDSFWGTVRGLKPEYHREGEKLSGFTTVKGRLQKSS